MTGVFWTPTLSDKAGSSWPQWFWRIRDAGSGDTNLFTGDHMRDVYLGGCGNTQWFGIFTKKYWFRTPPSQPKLLKQPSKLYKTQHTQSDLSSPWSDHDFPPCVMELELDHNVKDFRAPWILCEYFSWFKSRFSEGVWTMQSKSFQWSADRKGDLSSEQCISLLLWSSKNDFFYYYGVAEIVFPTKFFRQCPESAHFLYFSNLIGTELNITVSWRKEMLH